MKNLQLIRLESNKNKPNWMNLIFELYFFQWNKFKARIWPVGFSLAEERLIKVPKKTINSSETNESCLNLTKLLM